MNELARRLCRLVHGPGANANVCAGLRVIREGESSQDEDAYRMRFGGALVDDLSAHPGTTVRRGRYKSTAAGAYQFLLRTWQECEAALDLADFLPAAQDAAALYLIERRGVLDELVAGDLEGWLRECSWEWASLPPWRYPPQRGLTVARCRHVFQKWGGVLA